MNNKILWSVAIVPFLLWLPYGEYRYQTDSMERAETYYSCSDNNRSAAIIQTTTYKRSLRYFRKTASRLLSADYQENGTALQNIPLGRWNEKGYAAKRVIFEETANIFCQTGKIPRAEQIYERLKGG